MAQFHDAPTPEDLPREHGETQEPEPSLTRFRLCIGDGVDLIVTAPDSRRTWNGHAVPILTQNQACIVGHAIDEDDWSAGESDGLQWEII